MGFMLFACLAISAAAWAETRGVEIQPVNTETNGFEKNGSGGGLTWITEPVSGTDAETVTTVDSNSDNLWRARRFGAEKTVTSSKKVTNLDNIGVLESKTGTGGTEDAPAVKTTVTFSQAGVYTLFFRYGDGRSSTERYDIQYAVNDGDFQEIHLDYDEATEGDSVDGSVYIFVAGFEIWEKFIGSFEVNAGDSITIIADDIIQDGPGSGDRSVYAGLRVTGANLDLDPPSMGLEVDIVNADTTGLEKAGADGAGNTWTSETVGVSDADGLTTVDSGTDNKWRPRRFGAGPTALHGLLLTNRTDFGVLESKIGDGTEDAPPVHTALTFAKAGTYTLYLRYGTGRGSANERYDIQYSFDGSTWYITRLNYDEALEGDAWDGAEYISLAGFEIWERNIGTFDVAAGGTIDVYVDDVIQDGPNTNDRSVYAGLRVTGGGLGGGQVVDAIGYEVDPLNGSSAFLRDGGDGKGTTWRTFSPIDEFEEPIGTDDRFDSFWWGRRDTIEAGPLGIKTRFSSIGLIESGGPPDEDAYPIRSEITLAEAGTYDVWLRYANGLAADNRYDIQYSLNDGDPVVLRLVAEEGATKSADGSILQHFYGATRSRELWEKKIGTVTVTAGETIAVQIDDVEQDGPNADDRTAYAGLRVVNANASSSIGAWELF
ncbi:MAG: hypothetical protein GC154_03895 [bacterium]|nr:hypothetical protein [bacterium]